jgi:hypothetical protein
MKRSIVLHDAAIFEVDIADAEGPDHHCDSDHGRIPSARCVIS